MSSLEEEDEDMIT